MEKLIFNTSMPRSGSELLQVILHQNPRIYGSSTSPLLEYQFAARANRVLPEVRSQNPKHMEDAFLSMCSAMALGYYKMLTDRPVVCDKNRGWSHYFEWVESWMRARPKMICMVRDMRSIIGSMERIYRSTRDLPEGPDNPAQLSCMSTDQRAVHWLQSQPIGLAIQRTLDCFQRGISDHMLFVRYEDLCSDPGAAMARIYEFIEEEPFEHDFSHLRKEIEEDDSHFGVYGRHQVKEYLRAVPVSDWKDVLPAPVANHVRSSVPWYNDAFAY